MFVLTAACALATPSLAAEPATPAAHRAAMHAVALSCTEDYPRFCPDQGTSEITARDQLICLKPFKTDLSLPCRKAVTAATQ